MKRLVIIAGLFGVVGLWSQPAAAQLTSELFIACHDTSKVVRLDVSTGVLTDPFVATGSGGLNIATGVTFGPDGNVYVTGRDSSTVVRYDKTGAFLDVFVDASAGWLFDARFGPDDRLYVLANNEVLRYDRTGAPAPAPGQNGAVLAADFAVGELRGLAFGRDGSPYVATDGGYIYRVDADSGAATEFASGPAGIGFHGLVFGTDGDLYVASPWDWTVRRFDGVTGELVGLVAVDLGYAMGIAVGPNGNLYVSNGDLMADRIVEVDATNGAVIHSFSAGCGGSWGFGPSWITFRPDTTPPVVSATASPTVLWPPNGKLVPVTISGSASDANGDVAATGSYTVTDEYGLVQPTGTFAVSSGTYSFTVMLAASRLGADMDGRRYTANVTVKDQAGNETVARVDIVVPHDQGQRRN